MPTVSQNSVKTRVVVRGVVRIATCEFPMRVGSFAELSQLVVCDRGCAGCGAWAASRHSLLIVTADEGDDGSDNRIATIVSDP